MDGTSVEHVSTCGPDRHEIRAGENWGRVKRPRGRRKRRGTESTQVQRGQEKRPWNCREVRGGGSWKLENPQTKREGGNEVGARAVGHGQAVSTGRRCLLFERFFASYAEWFNWYGAGLSCVLCAVIGCIPPCPFPIWPIGALGKNGRKRQRQPHPLNMALCSVSHKCLT